MDYRDELWINADKGTSFDRWLRKNVLADKPAKKKLTDDEALELLRKLRPKLEAGLTYLRDRGD